MTARAGRALRRAKAAFRAALAQMIAQGAICWRIGRIGWPLTQSTCTRPDTASGTQGRRKSSLSGLNYDATSRKADSKAGLIPKFSLASPTQSDSRTVNRSRPPE